MKRVLSCSDYPLEAALLTLPGCCARSLEAKLRTANR